MRIRVWALRPCLQTGNIPTGMDSRTIFLKIHSQNKEPFVKRYNTSGILCALIIGTLAVSCSDLGYEPLRETIEASEQVKAVPGDSKTRDTYANNADKNQAQQEDSGGSGAENTGVGNADANGSKQEDSGGSGTENTGVGNAAENSGTGNTGADSSLNKAAPPQEEGMTIEEATAYVKTLNARETIKVRGSVSGAQIQAFARAMSQARKGGKTSAGVDLDLSRTTGLTNLPNKTFHFGGNGEGNSLYSIILPEGLTAIGNRAFVRANGLESIVFPASLAQIGDLGIYTNTNLKWVEFKGSTPPRFGMRVFQNDTSSSASPAVPPQLEIRVPSAVISAYKNAMGSIQNVPSGQQDQLKSFVKPAPAS